MNALSSEAAQDFHQNLNQLFQMIQALDEKVKKGIDLKQVEYFVSRLKRLADQTKQGLKSAVAQPVETTNILSITQEVCKEQESKLQSRIICKSSGFPSRRVHPQKLKQLLQQIIINTKETGATFIAVSVTDQQIIIEGNSSRSINMGQSFILSICKEFGWILGVKNNEGANGADVVKINMCE